MALDNVWLHEGQHLRSLRDGTTRPADPEPMRQGRQLFGMVVQSSGGGVSPPLNQNAEDLRIGQLLGWDTGPDVQRIFQQTQSPPYSHMETILAQGRMPWFSLKPGTGGVAGDRAGARDAYWANWGTYLAQFHPQPIWFTYDHENDRHSHSGSPRHDNPGWVNYQNDFREAFRRIIGIMRAADPTNGLSHVHMGPILTGWAFRTAASRDVSLSWHPDFDFIGCDPYDFWLRFDGTIMATRRPLFFDGTASSGAHEYYKFGTDPLGWYAQYHPTWAVPSIITDNLDKFPIRMAIAEAGTSFDLRPNANGTGWIPQEDPDDPTSWQGAWFTQMGHDLRENYPRIENVCYFHYDFYTPGEARGYPMSFAGPAANRYGAEWAGPIAAYRTEVRRPEHHGTPTPWTPGGVA